MHDAIDSVLRKHPFHIRSPGNVHFVETEAVSIALKPLETRLLQRYVIVVVEIVYTKNAVSSLQKPFGDMKANETGRTGYQHAGLSVLEGPRVDRDRLGPTKAHGQHHDAPQYVQVPARVQGQPPRILRGGVT